jgi:molybdopterin-guanine dinucleotide biosynthesis protein B
LPLILSLCGHHNSGKTTLGTFLVQELIKDGYKVGVVKSTKEEGALTDKPGTDTWRYRRAGAYKVCLFQKDLVTLYLPSFCKSQDFLEYLRYLFYDCDLLLLEGFKYLGGISKIWVLSNGEDPEEIKKNLSMVELIVDSSEKDRTLEYVKKKLEVKSKTEVSLWVNEGEITLKPFIQDILKNLILGFLRGLKGVPEEVYQIEVKIKKK